jgi:demethylmenaquinone methyltransferase/2-methoxy-6-polyprenyl-1,4-benzoquinol methylase
VARKRNTSADKTGPATITFTKGDAENLDFPDVSFSAATVAFGVRNFGDLQAGLKEIHRVLQPGAPFVVLEFTRPRTFPVKQLFQIYFRHVLPLIGAWTSGDKRAYTYLFESVQAFPDYERFTAELERAGFVRTAFKPLSLGICAIYIGFKS